MVYVPVWHDLFQEDKCLTESGVFLLLEDGTKFLLDTAYVWVGPWPTINVTSQPWS